MPRSMDGPRARSLLGAGAIALASLAAAGCQSGSGSAQSAPGSHEDARIADLRSGVRAMVGQARDKVFPALVNIDVVVLEYQGGKEAKARQSGSGTIISPDGLVLTNAHVVDQGHKFWCVLSDKQRIPATLVGEDPWTDLALLKIETAKLNDPAKPLPTAQFGDSDQLVVGDYVLAMGSPFSLSRTVTLGIVSNTERVLTSAGEAEDLMLNGEQRTGLFTNWIQHDALINPGNSGGPLVNLLGQVVGVNTRGGAGMAFASPSNLARQVSENLRTRGEVLRSSIGAAFRHTQNTGIEELGGGVLVDSVETSGPAWGAGLRPGDVVTAIDGQGVNIRFSEEVPPLLKKIADHAIGSTVTLSYLRAGQRSDASITTEKLLKEKGEEAALRTWGLTAQRITDRAAQLRKFPSTRGAIVTSLRNGGPAEQAEPKLGWGDVIRAIDGAPINSLADLIDKYKQVDAMKVKPEYVLVEFERESKSYLTLLKPKPEERPDPAPETAKAWIGVATQPVIKAMAEKLASGTTGADQKGFRVVRVYSGTNAAKSGLKIGDIIYSLDGTKIQPKGLQEAGLLNREVRRMSSDQSVVLGVYRAGSPVEIKLDLEHTRQTADEVPRVRNPDFELAVREITFFDREDQKWSDAVKGVVVDSAEPAGWAGLAGIQPGDLIQKIGDAEIIDTASYKRAMEKVKQTQPERVVFVVYRGVRTYFRFVEPDWKPTERKSPKE